MSNPHFEIRQGESGEEYYQDGVKIAFINEQGTIQAEHGKASKKPALLEWLEKSAHNEAEAEVIAEHSPEVEPPSADEEEAQDQSIRDALTSAVVEHAFSERKSLTKEPSEALPDVEVVPSEANIVCPITPDGDKGDKDPRVIQWWFKNHPKIAGAKYAGRKFSKPND